MSDTCPNCGSTEIIPNARVIDHEEGYELDLNVEVYEHPEAKLDSGRRGRYGSVRAQVCGSCGHATFFVTNARKLWAAYCLSRPS